MTQAALPGTYLTSETTTCWQEGQQTSPGSSVRYAGEMGTGRGWLTAQALPTGSVTPTRHKYERTKGECRRPGGREERDPVPCVRGWTMVLGFGGGGAADVGTLGGVRRGKGSGWLVTTE